MFRFVRRAAIAAALLLVVAVAASAQDRRQSRPGQFDFYVLALSGSPSFCEASAEKGRAPKEQCGSCSRDARRSGRPSRHSDA